MCIYFLSFLESRSQDFFFTHRAYRVRYAPPGRRALLLTSSGEENAREISTDKTTRIGPGPPAANGKNFVVRPSDGFDGYPQSLDSFFSRCVRLIIAV